MNKFGLVSDEEDLLQTTNTSLSDILASFPAAAPKHRIDVAAMDAAAAPHGFVSREAASTTPPQARVSRRRRINPAEPTRHLAIRLTESQYERFVAYADRFKLTYHDALSSLLDKVID